MSTARLNGIIVGYDDVGSGVPLVLVHGHPFNRSMWQPQVAHFSRSGWRVIAPDLRGYGDSTVAAGKTSMETFASDIAGLLDDLDIARVVLGGISMGGQIAMEFHRLFPDRLLALVLVDTSAQAETDAGERARNEMADRLLREGMAPYAEEVLPKMIAPDNIDALPAVAEHVLAMMRATAPEGAAAALRGRAERPDYVEMLSRIAVPAMIAVGRDDEFTPVSDAELMHERIPNSRLVVIEGAAHLPNLEHADVFNDRLQSFLETIRDKPPTATAPHGEGVEADIRPFRIQVPETELDDLRGRLARTRWPDELPGLGWEEGVPLGYLRELADYWRTSYDWRKHEARLNELPQFTTGIDGTNVHFVHARSPEPNALPLLITHGWPGSIVELAEIIGPLSDPRAHGGDPTDAFHVVAPSIPGFAFSGPVQESGWGLRRITEALAALMGRLGYERYGAHGGDFGALLSPELGRLHPDRVIGVHVNGFLTQPPRDPAELAELSEEERQRVEAFTRFWRNARGYAAIQATRPQTLAYALTDSPVGQLAWIVEKFKEWTDSSERPEDAVDRDQLLTNVTVYWLTATAGSSARLYRETANDLRRANGPSTVPTGVAVFPAEPLVAVRRFAEREHNIVHWSEFDRGGHFPAMEMPDLLVGDLREFFCRLRSSRPLSG